MAILSGVMPHHCLPSSLRLPGNRLRLAVTGLYRGLRRHTHRLLATHNCSPSSGVITCARKNFWPGLCHLLKYGIQLLGSPASSPMSSQWSLAVGVRRHCADHCSIGSIRHTPPDSQVREPCDRLGHVERLFGIVRSSMPGSLCLFIRREKGLPSHCSSDRRS